MEQIKKFYIITLHTGTGFGTTDADEKFISFQNACLENKIEMLDRTLEINGMEKHLTKLFENSTKRKIESVNVDFSHQYYKAYVVVCSYESIKGGIIDETN